MARRILVVGPNGSGKTTIALQLARALNLPIFHLDREFWLPGFVLPNSNDWLEQVARLAARDEWIIEGNYFDTLEPRLKRAEAMIWIDVPRRVYLPRLLSRVLRHYGRERYDLGAGLRERLHLPHLLRAYSYPHLQRPRLERALAGDVHSGLLVIRLGTLKDIKTFLSDLPSSIWRSSTTLSPQERVRDR